MQIYTSLHIKHSKQASYEIANVIIKKRAVLTGEIRG